MATTIPVVLPYANLIAASASTIGAVLAYNKPSTLSGSSGPVSPGEQFYVRMYVARAVPFGIAAGLLPFFYSGPGVAQVVFVAAAIQLADVGIGASKGDIGMMVGASIAAIIHFFCGRAIN